MDAMLRLTDDIARVGRSLDATDIALDVVDARARFTLVNDTFERITGFERAEVCGASVEELFFGEAHGAKVFEELWTACAFGRPHWDTHEVRRKDGELVSCDVLVWPMMADGSLSHAVTLRRVAEPRGHNHELYGAMIRAAQDAVLVSDWETAQFIEVNPAARELFGYHDEEFRAHSGRTLCAANQGERISSFSAHMHERSYFKDTLRFQKKDGTEFWADVSAASFMVRGAKRMVTIVRDVDERVRRGEELEASYRTLKDTQAKLMHTSQLATIGQLAAGVAHEINNPASYVDLSFHLIAGKLDEVKTLVAGGEDPTAVIADMHKLVAQCREGLERITVITRDLRTYARPSAEEMEVVDVSDIIAAAVRMVRNQIRHVAELDVETDDVFPVVGDALKLGQVVTNLLVNAAHAVQAAGEKWTEDRGVAGQICLRVRERGPMVCIEVTDTGVGVTEEVRARMFEPFFTTKSQGSGTGLGLSLCAEIVDQHGGTIDVQSVVGEGTTVSVLIPRANEPITSLPPSSSTTPGVAARLRILVVDDESAVLDVFKRVLSREHTCVGASGGREALSLLREDPEFDVVLCDLMMPQVDGLEVYERLGEWAPELQERLLFISGGAISDRVRDFARALRDRVLDKPIAPHDLREAVEKLARRVSRRR